METSRRPFPLACPARAVRATLGCDQYSLTGKPFVVPMLMVRMERNATATKSQVANSCVSDLVCFCSGDNPHIKKMKYGSLRYHDLVGRSLSHGLEKVNNGLRVASSNRQFFLPRKKILRSAALLLRVQSDDDFGRGGRHDVDPLIVAVRIDGDDEETLFDLAVTH
jgi:hypothetical protein